MGNAQSRFTALAVVVAFAAGAGIASVYFSWHGIEKNLRKLTFQRQGQSSSSMENILKEEINIYNTDSTENDERFLLALNSLLNGGGGKLVLSNLGYQASNRNANMILLDLFRQKYNDRLRYMINDSDRNIADIFKTQNEEFETKKGSELTYTVEGLEGPHALNWHSSSKDDFALNEDTTAIIRKCLREQKPDRYQPSPKQISNDSFRYNNRVPYGEDKSIEYKGYEKVSNFDSLKKRFSDDLPGYVSAFAKHLNGGQFYCGICENKTEGGWIVAGIGLITNDRYKEKLKLHIKNVISKDMCWLSSDRSILSWDEVQPYFDVHLFNVEGAEQSHIIGISVARFYGVAFRRRMGPLIKTLRNGRQEPVTPLQVYDGLVEQDFEYDFLIMHNAAENSLATKCKTMIARATGKPGKVARQCDVVTPGTRVLNIQGYLKKSRYIIIIIQDTAGLDNCLKQMAYIASISRSDDRVIPAIHRGVTMNQPDYNLVNLIDLDDENQFITSIRALFRQE